MINEDNISTQECEIEETQLNLAEKYLGMRRESVYGIPNMTFEFGNIIRRNKDDEQK